MTCSNIKTTPAAVSALLPSSLSPSSSSSSSTASSFASAQARGSINRARRDIVFLESVFKLRGGSDGARGVASRELRFPPVATFLRRLHDGLSRRSSKETAAKPTLLLGSSTTTAPNLTTTCMTKSSSAAGTATISQQVHGALRSTFFLRVVGKRQRGSTIASFLVGIACILSVAAAASDNSVVLSCPADWATRARTRGATTNSLAVVVCVPEGESGYGGGKPRLLSLKKRLRFGDRRRGKRRRRTVPLGRLFRAPRFPLAHVSWWKAFRNRRKRLPLTVAEGVAVEDHEVTDRAQGAQVFRAAQFWGRSVTIYLSYKKMQARCALKLPRIANLEEREAQCKAWWDATHELNSDRMLNLCLDLRGFYLKSGQFLGTRHDFMPKVFLQKLGKLHDDVPPMPASRVSEVLSRELDMPVKDLFSSLNLTHPVGSASISQVHSGVLRETGEKVAVKVQYPGAERVMMSDLRNLKVLAWFLQKFELKFDISSSLRELSKQIKGEFDFRAEARTMDRMYDSLGGHSERVSLPNSRLSTQRVLVMSYLEGESLAQLKRGGKERFVAARKRIGKDLLHELADAWGFMIFQEGLFNADPHPGNILIMPEERVGPIKRGFSLLGLRTPKLRIGLLDWGQIKELSRKDQEKVANVILAVSSKHSANIVRCFNKLGVKLSNPDDGDSIEKLALLMFDTRTIKGIDFNPFSTNNVLKLNAVKEYPQDLYFVLRTVLMFRGMAQSLGVEFSLADFWAPHASRLLASPPAC